MLKVAKLVRSIIFPQKDLTAWREAGGTRAALEALIEAAPDLIKLPSEPPPPHEAELILAELNADQAVVIIGARTRVLRFENTPHDAGGEHYVHRLLTFLRFDDFRNFYLNRLTVDAEGEPFATDAKGNPISIGRWWLGHPNRKTYQGVTFLPGGEPIIDRRLNLWTGFGVEPKRGKWGRMREHIFEVLAARDDAVNDYILNWLADAVQRPDRQAEAALVLLGGVGTGKGLLGRAMCRIFGQHGRHISASEHLTGKFNAHMQMCCFLFADEAFAPQDKKAEGAIKPLVTEDTLFIEPKGVDPFEVPNRLHVMLASNHDWVIPASEKERRYVVQQVDETRQQDEKWFNPIYQEMRSGGLQAMMYDLLDRNLGDWRPRKIVRTAALAKQQEESLSPFDQWWLELLQTAVLDGVANKNIPDEATSNSYEEVIDEELGGGFYGKQERKRTVERDGLYDQARRVSPRLKGVSDTALGRYLSEQGCENTWVHRQRGWRVPPLQQCRDRWKERFPETIWHDPLTTKWTSGEDEEPLSRDCENEPETDFGP
jgi:hypothetical protein